MKSEAIGERGEEWGKEVVSRVNSVLSDVHEADARYHKDCYKKFYTSVPTQATTYDSDKALDQLVNHMRSDKSRIWNSVELHKFYGDHGGTKLS